MCLLITSTKAHNHIEGTHWYTYIFAQEYLQTYQCLQYALECMHAMKYSTL